MKHVVFTCQVFYPDSTSTSQLFTELFGVMADRELKITVLCGFPTSEKGEVARVDRRETYRGIEIHRCGIRIDHKRNMASRAVSYFCHTVQAFWTLLWMKRPDVILGVTNPPLVAQLLWLVSKLRGIPYQYMILDAYPEGLVALGQLGSHSPVTRVWYWMNGIAYRRAEKLVVLGRDMTGLLKKNYGVSDSQIVYIPHWSAVELEEPAEFADNAMAERLELRDKFVVQYSGNMGLWHDIEGLVRTAALLQDDPTIRFLFIGAGMRRKKAEALSRELGLTNIIWHKFVPLSQLRESLSCCHASLISLRAGLEGVAVPSKLYGILASGRAIIGQVPKESEIALVLEEEDCGIVVEPGDVEGVAEAVRSMARDRQATRDRGARAFAAYRTKYRLEQALGAFRQLWELEGATAECEGGRSAGAELERNG